MTNEMNIIIYQGKNGTRVDLKSSDFETIWATQEQIATIFDKSISSISEHISNIYRENELVPDETFREFRNVSNQPIKHYNLDMIIAVGYRVNSTKATQFRIWATKILKEWIICFNYEM
ncbi:RhuM family protein [Candidatus Deianiraea vastatrix]|uniref:RhuM family Fic-related virulence protein n=1 Tax=Candidatus Deianiraea vastatrix TaxID=2163644 RepID=A0A5B8XEQ3_9RICK|nr:RhuM family protein [Candidatus Deianiraea vastatrix]QED23446.1 Putative RhuM family Fic-related virulence protein [Candidatus Deianiraea vastatrix]